MNDSLSSFDPSSFLDATTTEQSVRRPPLPPGDYTAVTGELKARQWTSKKQDAKIKAGIAFDVPLTLEVPLHIQEELKLPQTTVTMNDSIMVETTPQGGIDYGVGKNPSLRRWREATDLNTPGQPFNPRMLGGKVVKVKIGHRIAEEGPSAGEIFDEIQGVAKP
jgi:hypothetical protein